jgi:hypothetical protein
MEFFLKLSMERDIKTRSKFNLKIRTKAEKSVIQIIDDHFKAMAIKKKFFCRKQYRTILDQGQQCQEFRGQLNRVQMLNNRQPLIRILSILNIFICQRIKQQF